MKNKKRTRKWYDYALNLVIVALILGGLYFLLRPVYVKYQRAKIANELLKIVDNKSLETFAINPRANRLSEAEYDYFNADGSGNVVAADALRETRTTDAPELMYLTPFARIDIPKLGFNVSIIKELDYYAMFYAVSHWDETPLPGERGNSAMFIHRNSFESYDFTEAQRMLSGDKIFITMDGKKMTFEVVGIDTIIPDEIINTIKSKYQDDAYITLVTCTPIPTFEMRMLVTAKLIKTEKLP